MVPEAIAECMRASSSDRQISKPLELKQTGWGIELEKWWRHKGMGLIETLGIQGQIVPGFIATEDGHMHCTEKVLSSSQNLDSDLHPILTVDVHLTGKVVRACRVKRLAEISFGRQRVAQDLQVVAAPGARGGCHIVGDAAIPRPGHLWGWGERGKN